MNWRVSKVEALAAQRADQARSAIAFAFGAQTGVRTVSMAIRAARGMKEPP